jgi:TPR repeat protein
MKINRFFSAVVQRMALFLVLGLALSVTAQDTNLNFQAAQAGADKGDAKAQYDLARCYERGIGVPRNFTEAARYAELSAQQGYAPGEVLLGAYYGRGIGKALNVRTAVQWYRKAADQGDPVAQYAMGNFYRIGRGVTNDMNQAIEWWQKAAAQNQVDAEARLGQLYLIPEQPYGDRYVDPAKALPLLRRAAAQGSAGAMNNLGVAYEDGSGVEQDFKEAAKWYEVAAERGDAMGQANLGQLYFDGRGVPLDLVQAYKWFKLSANQGNFVGQAGMENYQTHKLLKPKQIGDAEQMVADFRPKTGGVQ